MSIIRATEDGIEIDGILLKDTVDIKAYIEAHQPEAINISIGIVQPLPLNISITGVTEWPGETINFTAYINSHIYSTLSVYQKIHEPLPLYAEIEAFHVRSIIAWFFTVEFGQTSLPVQLKGVYSEYSHLFIDIHIWSLAYLSVYLGIMHPYDLSASVWAWTPSNINVLIGITHPPPVVVYFQATAQPGYDLIVQHGFYKYSSLSASFDIWTGLYNLHTDLWGVYKSELQVEFRMGGYLRLEIPLPGTSGYRDLFITLKPSSRMMTTIIPVYTIEIKDLYVSINQGWPCGFGSSYKLLYVSFDSAYFHAFVATFKVIDGSGTDMVAIYVNRSYFDTYLKTFNLNIYIPEESITVETRIMDEVSIVYDNQFADLYQDIMQVTFNWPRIRLLYGTSSFLVELIPYKGDKTYELSILLVANRQLPMVQPPTRPLMMRDSPLEEPIWPDIFQVTEIELWGNDPPEVVRRIEIKFEEQIHEYYWVSTEQRAYSKKTWEQWAFLTRGYLPHSEYSGQIDYVTMRSLSSMERYDTIDQAVKAMISGFLYTGKTNLDIILNPVGKISLLSVELTIRDWSRLKNLRVVIEPMHTHSLTVDLEAV